MVHKDASHSFEADQVKQDCKHPEQWRPLLNFLLLNDSDLILGKVRNFQVFAAFGCLYKPLKCLILQDVGLRTLRAFCALGRLPW